MSAMSMDSSHSEVAILGRLIHRVTSPLAPEAARALLEMDFPAEDQQRMKSLATKAADGTLTAEERAELECYNRVSYMLSVLHASARRALSKG
jgi:hypothetical protein